MANEEHLKILRQGVHVWNRWREQNPEIIPDLSRAELVRADLRRMDLRWADLIGANLRTADLRGANLSQAGLIGTNLRLANLSGANLSQAALTGTNLTQAVLTGADLSRATLAWGTFGNVDLGAVKGLDTVEHFGPSTIGIDTIYRSKANIPEVFLRGAGVPDSFIEYMASLGGKPIEFYSCFISYSSKDQVFAERLHNGLQDKGVRCWFAPEDMKIGDRIRPAIDQAVRSYDKLLLVLSEHSIDSDWVEKEVETAFEEERKRKTTILFPIRLDSAVMETDQAWAADICRTRHIGDFTNWKDHDAYQKAFDRLLRDLKAEDVVEADT
jgi:hypothetical protein